jgi:hypothetical protein
MRFKYLLDPLFLGCLLAYFFNRMVLKTVSSHSFFRDYFNDVICVPLLVPPMLLVARILHLRSHDDPPLPHEVFVPTIVWAIMYEIVLPASSDWGGNAISDPYDVLAYVIGACIALPVWEVIYPDRITETLKKT